jgi:hypothetical protein
LQEKALAAALALMSPVGASVVIAVVKPWTLDVPVSRPALPCHIAPLVGGRRRYFYTLKNQLQKLLIIFCDDPKRFETMVFHNWRSYPVAWGMPSGIAECYSRF